VAGFEYRIVTMTVKRILPAAAELIVRVNRAVV